MKWKEKSTCWLTNIDKMTKISKWIFFRNLSFESWKHRNFFLRKCIFFTSDFDITIAGKCLTMTTNTSRKDTVHHVNSSCNSLDEILGCSYSHEIVWLIFWKDRRKDIENMIHVFLALSYRESANSNSWKIKWLDEFTWFSTKILIDNSLNNTEKCLWMKSFFSSFLFIFSPLFLWSDCPAMRPFHSNTSIFSCRSAWRTFIKCHHDVCPKRILHIHHRLRSEEMLRSIEIWTKMDAILGNTSKHLIPPPLLLQRRGAPDLPLSFRRGVRGEVASKRKYLKSSRIRKYRNIYIHKLMKPTEWSYHITSWSKIAMVIIHEHDLWSNFFYLIDRCSLHSTSSTDRHKYRSLDNSMRSRNRTSTSKSVSGIERKKHKKIVSKGIDADYREFPKKDELFLLFYFLPCIFIFYNFHNIFYRFWSICKIKISSMILKFLMKLIL